MRPVYYQRIFTTLLLLLSCCFAEAQQCSDTSGTPALRRLFSRLQEMQTRYTVFGHQDALAYGVGWKKINGQSDVRSVAGDFPGLYGWDIGHLEMEQPANIDNVSFQLMKKYIREGAGRGGLITISWHLHNPLTGGSAWDTAKGTVASVLPGGAKHNLYRSWLDQVALFMNDLKDSKGKHIPVLFRPFHELTGNWFWWCRNVCIPEEFIALWRFTVHYLRDEKKIHHLLYVYNAAAFSTPEEFLSRYPGDDVVDVLSFDLYQFGLGDQKQYFITEMRRQADMLCSIAAGKKKIAAIAETGLEALPDKEWWTGTLWPAIKDFPLSYVLVWRNHGYMAPARKMHYYAPYPGQVSAADFKKFASNPRILFEKGLKQQKIYQ